MHAEVWLNMPVKKRRVPSTWMGDKKMEKQSECFETTEIWMDEESVQVFYYYMFMRYRDVKALGLQANSLKTCFGDENLFTQSPPRDHGQTCLHYFNHDI